MTTYSFTETQTTFKVDYEDPAGGFAGWFLHVVHTPTPFVGSPTIEFFGIGHPPYEGGAISASEWRTERVRKGIFERLERMFGSAGCVKWTATLVQSVTPASIDTDF